MRSETREIIAAELIDRDDNDERWFGGRRRIGVGLGLGHAGNGAGSGQHKE